VSGGQLLGDKKTFKREYADPINRGQNRDATQQVQAVVCSLTLPVCCRPYP
jgi:hypothetical protein